MGYQPMIFFLKNQKHGLVAHATTASAVFLNMLFPTPDWRGKPLISHDLIVKLIGGTTTSAGLKVKAALDPARHESGIKVSDEALNAVNIERDAFHGEWNCSIRPNAKVA